MEHRKVELRARWLKECDGIGNSSSDVRLDQRWRSLRTCVVASVSEMRANAAQARAAMCPGNAGTTYGERLEVMAEVYTACADELEAVTTGRMT